jgi:hypothetical protein
VGDVGDDVAASGGALPAADRHVSAGDRATLLAVDCSAGGAEGSLGRVGVLPHGQDHEGAEQHPDRGPAPVVIGLQPARPPVGVADGQAGGDAQRPDRQGAKRDQGGGGEPGAHGGLPAGVGPSSVDGAGATVSQAAKPPELAVMLIGAVTELRRPVTHRLRTPARHQQPPTIATTT